jgi:hypothetical protein
MPAYQQMGHHTVNLIEDPLLERYRGAILSPVNYTEAEISNQVVRANPDFDMVFDPQLYFPRTERGQLRTWRYFPSDVDTADLSSDAWWQRIADRLAETCGDIKPNAVCSPATVPRTYRNEHYAQMVRVGSFLAEVLEGTGMRPIQTAIAGLADLSTTRRSLEVASILSRSVAGTVYLIFVGDTDPRRELSDSEELKGAMRLIASLEESGLTVIIGFSSSDMVLWKAAGATSCATGKFFNLRRFTSSRFEEPSQGGGQLPYWFEESLLAFLRESDLLRLQRADRLGQTSLSNPFGLDILEQLSSSPGEAWVALGWRQFMYAFADLEGRISDGSTEVAGLLSRAERSWLELEDSGILMEEPRNDGTWLRPWRRAFLEYQDH